MRTIEVCCSDQHDALAAKEGGASRIELCAALELGGITPSLGLIQAVHESMGVDGPDINVLIRPRGGNFVYDSNEVTQMTLDIVQCRLMGVNGVVVGALTAKGDIDIPTCKMLIEAAKAPANNLPPLSVTFHRAFDVCRSPEQALEDIITLGFDRILTSGLNTTALLGAETIASLIDQAAERIIIMPGCGITTDNIAEIEFITNAVEFHSTARAQAVVHNVYTNPKVDFDELEPTRHTSAELVRELVG